MQIDLPCIQIQALKSKILNLSFLAVCNIQRENLVFSVSENIIFSNLYLAKF
jgi:hypothetical protein